MTSLQISKSLRCQANEMANMRNGKQLKWLVGELQVDKLVSRQSDKQTKWLEREMASR